MLKRIVWMLAWRGWFGLPSFAGTNPAGALAWAAQLLDSDERRTTLANAVFQLDPAQAVDVAQQYRDAEWGNLDAEYAGIQRADLRIGVNRRFPANLAESEFGVPGGGQA